MVYAICGVALLGAIFMWSSRTSRQKERTSLDTPLFTLTPNGKYVIGFSLIFGAVCAALALYLKGALF